MTILTLRDNASEKLWAEARFEKAARQLDWAGVAGAMAGPGEGRGDTRLIELCAGLPRVLLRPLVRGGLLGPFLGWRLLGPGRVRRELEATARLHQRGAAVPAPALARAARRGLFWQAAIATVWIEGSSSGGTFLRAPLTSAAAIAVAGAAGRALRRFHDAGGCHADLQVDNLVVATREGECLIWIVDLDRSVLRDSPPPAARRMKEVMRLHRSLRKQDLLSIVGSRGLAAFLSAYCDGNRALRRELLASLPREQRRNALHAVGWKLRQRPSRR